MRRAKWSARNASPLVLRAGLFVAFAIVRLRSIPETRKAAPWFSHSCNDAWPMEKGGVAVGLATISVVLAALVFAAEKALTGPMQFIERYLGFSPDGGDGSTEILLAVVLVALVVMGATWLATKPAAIAGDARSSPRQGRRR